MSLTNFGASSGFIAMGVVVDHENDPSQSGMVKVRWMTGAAVQDQLSDDDLPWTRTLFPSTDPALSQTGGPHTGLRKGSTVVGIPLDGQGQDYLVIGSTVKSGSGSEGGGQVTYDSDIPRAAKSASIGGQAQPRYGDVNGIVTETSIVAYAGQSAQFASLDDSVGVLDSALA